MKMTLATAALIAFSSAAAAEQHAASDQNELLFITNVGENGSSFNMFSYRRDLPALGDGQYRLRLDASHGEFDLNPGTGSIDTMRVGLSYVDALSSSMDVTVTSALSWRDREPEGTNILGLYTGVELFSSNQRGDDLFLLAEFDSGDKYGFLSASYLTELGSFSVGPTVNYLDEGDFFRKSAGAIVAFDVTQSTELKFTAAWAEQNADVGASYIELQVRSSF